jgi:hypothetical protein
MIVRCSASGNGSNIRPLDGYVAPTGGVRWTSGSRRLDRLSARSPGFGRAREP